MSSEMETDGVRLLRGDPRKALRTLAVPMILAMAVQMAYNLIDAAWVSGLGTDALAAMGFSMPIFQIIFGVGMGLATGAGTAMARRIGAHDHEGANRVAVNGLALVTVAGVVMTILMTVYAKDLLTMIGAEGESLSLSLDYILPLSLFASIILYFNLLNNTTLSEGNSKRAMRTMLIASVLNIVLDPVMIYGFDMGIAGAAWATLLAFLVSTLILARCYLVGDGTFISFRFRKNSLDMRVQSEILRVGAPTSVQEMSMAFSAFVVMAIILLVGSSDDVAVYSSGFRIFSLAIVPLFGIAMAMTTMSGVLFGARRYGQMLDVHRYAVRLGLLFELVVGSLIFVFAPVIVGLYTWSDSTALLADGIVEYLRIMCVACLTAGMGIFSTSIFQGSGHGMKALIGNLVQFVFLEIGFTYLFAVVLDWGMVGVWWGIVTALSIGSIMLFTWVKLFVSRLSSEAETVPIVSEV